MSVYRPLARAGRWLVRKFLALAWWQQLMIVAAAPLCALNMSVALVGHSAVFPLSPFFLAEKGRALGLFAAHVPGCMWRGHPPTAEQVRAAEQRHRLPAGLLQAIIEVESSDSPHRISAAGAMGLAQLMPGTARQLKVDDPFDSAEAVDAGARYLAGNLRRTRNLRLAIAAYNAGPGAVDDGVMPRNAETQYYVVKVMRAYSRHRASQARPASPQRR